MSQALASSARAVRRSSARTAPLVLRLLRERLGWVGAAKVLASLGVARARGEPFGRLGPPASERERLTRVQAADLVLLHRALVARLGAPAALDACRAIAAEGARHFFDDMLADVSVPATPEAAAALVTELAARFFNTETVVAAQPAGVAMTVTRCLFVDLLAQVDAAVLVPLFCATDHAAFDGEARPIRLQRTRTLAIDGQPCDFVFSAATAPAPSAPSSTEP